MMKSTAPYKIVQSRKSNLVIISTFVFKNPKKETGDMKKLVVATAAMALCGGIAAAKNDIRVTELTCNGLVSPQAVEEVKLGWTVTSPHRGTVQSAYEIEVATSPEGLEAGEADVWRSGRVESRRQFDIRLPDASRPADGTACWWRVRIWDGDRDATPWSEPAYFSTGLSAGAWEARWISATYSSHTPLPYFRAEADYTRNGMQPSRAMVYLCALGCGQLYFNGREVDPGRVLDPAQTDYEKRALYTAFDVTGLLSPGGVNCVGVMASNGWYTQDTVWHPSFRYGPPMLLCQVNLWYPDGSTALLGSDQRWRWAPGPVLRSNVYQGVTYDARREIDGWCMPGFDDSEWQAPVAPSGPVPQALQPQEIPPIREQEAVRPVNVWPTGDGRTVYDFGVNMTANIRFSVTLPAGTRLTVRTGEALNPDGTVDFWSTGIEHVGYQEDVYICRGGGAETWTPRFTYHGFQYAELTVEGYAGRPDASWLSAVPVRTDLDVTGSFECSDEQVNRLHRIAVHTMLNNFLGVPVDCPQREKCGWLGDTHAYAQAANLNFAMQGFWTKYLGDIRTNGADPAPNTLFHQRNNDEFYWADKPAGIPYMIAPGRRQCGVASPDWGTALVQLPWYLYVYYSDRDILGEYYDLMKTWTDHISSTAIDGIVYQGLGDWCPPGNTRARDTPIEFTSTAFHYLDLRVMERTARLLGHEADAERFAIAGEETAAAIRRKFYHPVMKTFGTQTADAMALHLGLAPADEAGEVARSLARHVERYHGFFNTGIFGLCRIGSSLSRNGLPEAAWDAFTKKGDYSFGFMLDEMGATTLWEELPVYAERAARAGMNSRSHPMQGGYDLWCYEDIAGIRPDESNPGFATVILDPMFRGGPEWARATVRSRYGHITSDWIKEGGVIRWTVALPANTSGLVAIPDGYVAEVDSRPLTGIPYPAERSGKGRTYHRIPSGTYEILLRTSEQ
ncbi:MAG: glycoside hydrolase family 78 protein [Alistipes sp.]|nr:glycoside hydrolase family 78 protein [Alistipes sp.]